MNQAPYIDINGLIKRGGAGPSISIFIPTHQAGADIPEDLIRFKNLLQEAERQLVEQGMKKPAIDELLSPARDLLQVREPWRHPLGGFAAFIAPGVFETFKVPAILEERLAIGEQFYVAPLLPLIGNNGLFYLLTLNQSEIRLYEGSRFGFHQVELDDVPSSVREILQEYEAEETGQAHSSSAPFAHANRGSAARPQAIFHGHGIGEDDHKDRILEFYGRIDRGVHDVIRGMNTPLVLAGVEYLHPIYHEANTYPYLLTNVGLYEDPRMIPEKELHDKVWNLLAPYYAKPQHEAADRYKRLAGTGKAANTLEDVLPAAFDGRIDSLFIRSGEPVWGAYDPEARTVTVDESRTNGSRDLIELAALRTIEAQGRVFCVDGNAIPDNAPVAAVLRY